MFEYWRDMKSRLIEFLVENFAGFLWIVGLLLIFIGQPAVIVVLFTFIMPLDFVSAYGLSVLGVLLAFAELIFYLDYNSYKRRGDDKVIV